MEFVKLGRLVLKRADGSDLPMVSTFDKKKHCAEDRAPFAGLPLTAVVEVEKAGPIVR